VSTIDAARSRFARIPFPVRVAAALVVAVILLNIGARILDRSVGGNAPTGAPASSFATAPEVGTTASPGSAATSTTPISRLVRR
jgi:hypothetical protein